MRVDDERSARVQRFDAAFVQAVLHSDQALNDQIALPGRCRGEVDGRRLGTRG